MLIREKLLVKIAQDPNYEGVDETEKAIVKELKEELAKEKGAPAKSETSTDVQIAAKELAAELVNMVKTIGAQTAAAAAPVNRPDNGNPNAVDLEAEVADKTKGMAEKEAKEFKKAYRFSEFARALYKKDLGRVKALAEGVDGDGGYLVPQEFRATLFENILASGSLRQFVTVIPMSTNYLEMPKLSADVAVYWGTENKQIATTSADFGNITLTPFRLNAIIYTSRELFDDSAIGIFDVLRRRFTERVRDTENKVILTGNGTTQPKGISQETLRGVSAASALTPDHLTQAYYKLPEGYRSTSRWVINSRVMEHLENKKDSNGQYLYNSLQGEVKTLKGRPIFVTDWQPSSTIILGDLSFYVLGDRQQLTMDVTTEAGTAWEKYQVGMRVIERIDGEVAITQPFVNITSTNIH